MSNLSDTEQAEQDALESIVYSPHEEINEPLNPPGQLTKGELPCGSELWFETGFQKTLFHCERLNGHTGKHTAHHTIPTHPRNIPKVDQNMHAGTVVSLNW